MMIVTLCEKTQTSLDKAFQRAIKKADLVEIRLDFLNSSITPKLKEMLVHPKALVTLRSEKEGGLCKRGKDERRSFLKEIIDLKPNYLDLEYARDLKLLEIVKKKSKKTKVILSYHNSKKTPPHLDQKVLLMKRHSAWKYKIAVYSKNMTESLKMLSLVQDHRDLIGISMGEKGRITRILGPLYNQPITYCYMGDKPLALGQISYDELKGLYHYSSLNSKTKLLGIIGNPLWQSPGYKTYNPLFVKEKINAIYLNFELEPYELSSFFRYCKKLGVLGLSVTIPFKEKVLKYVDNKHPKQKDIGSINTLLFKKEGLYGMNTDGLGAVELLEQDGAIQNKKVLIIGSGGTAYGVGYALKNKEALVTIMNRTDSKAKRLAHQLQADYKPFKELSCLSKDEYDILIHTTPTGNKNPNECLVPSQSLYAQKRVLDVVFKDTLLLKRAKKKNGAVYNGKMFWIFQAAKQFELWFKTKDPHLKKKLKAHMP